jgi:uncharacterized membrane protein YfcA
MESIEIIWIIAVVAVSAFAQSLAGFGFGLLAVPLMTLFVDAHDAVIVATMIGAVSTIAQALLDREHCEWPTARRLSIAAYAGMPLGLFAFVIVSESAMRLVLGIVVLLATLVLARGFTFTGQSRFVEWIMGAMSGVLSTSTSTNGPPLVFLLQARQMEAQTFRATINTVFAISNFGAIALFAISGNVEANGIVAAAASLPILFLALRAGYALRPRVDGAVFKKLVLVMLVLSGVSVLTSAFA